MLRRFVSGGSTFLQHIRTGIILTLAAQLAVPYTERARATEKPQRPNGSNTHPQQAFKKIINDALIDPWTDAVKNSPLIPWELNLSPNDPIVDTDPFFLRAQSWKPTSEIQSSDETDIGFTDESHGISIYLGHAQKSLHLNAPLRPIGTSDRFIFLAPQEGSNLFESKTPDEEVAGEGFFILPIEDLYKAHGTQDPTPIYFFPVPGNGWKDTTRVVNLPEEDTIVLLNKNGENLPIYEDDIDLVVKAQRLNLKLAQRKALIDSHAKKVALPGLSKKLNEFLDTYRSSPPKTDEEKAARLFTFSEFLTGDALLGQVLPQKGSTAGFGLLYTGFNTEEPGFALKKQWRDLTKWASTHLLPGRAYADEEDKEDEDEEDEIAASNRRLTDRLVRVAEVLAIALGAAVVMKYTVYRGFFAEKHQGELYQSVPSRVGREAMDVGDVFAHNLTALQNFARIMFGNVTQYSIDRYAPKWGAAENTLIRRFLQKTVYFSQSTSEKLAVNWRTFINGSAIMGGVDTSLVALQLYGVVPPLAHAIADAVPAMQSRVEEAFQVGNPVTATYNAQEVARNAAGWATSGASSFSQEIKGQQFIIIAGQVDQEMRKEGKEPLNPEFRAEREERIQTLLAAVEKQLGLPGARDFLFDVSTLWVGTMRLLGFTPPDATQGEKTAEEGGGGRYFGVKRPGLIIPAVREALKEVRTRLKHRPNDPILLNAALILEQTKADASILGSFIRMPVRFLLREKGIDLTGAQSLVERIRSTRRNLIALTEDGVIDASVRSIPGRWCEVLGEPGAQMAGQIFRQAYFSLLLGDKSILAGTNPSDEDLSRTSEEFYRRHAEELTELSQSEGREKAEASLRAKYAAEFRLISRTFARLRFQQEEEANKEFQPKESRYTQWQLRRILKKANARFFKANGRAFDINAANSEQEIASWNHVYQDTYLKQIGIYLDYEDAPELREVIEARAKEITDSELRKPAAQRYLAGLDPMERFEFEAYTHAGNLARTYIELTTSSSTLSAISPTQPGRFQWLRQGSTRRSKFVTRLIRAAESLVPVEQHKLGFWAAVARNSPFPLPWSYDIYLGVLRSLKMSVTEGTVVYWFNSVVWGIKLPYWLFTFNWLFRFTILAPSQWVTRFFRMQGWQPNGRLMSILGYSFIYSWVTFWGTFPVLIYQGDYKKYWDAVGEPLNRFFETSKETLLKAGEQCMLFFQQLL